MNEVRRTTNNSLHQCWPCLFDEWLFLHFFCLRHWQMIANLCSLVWSIPPGSPSTSLSTPSSFFPHYPPSHFCTLPTSPKPFPLFHINPALLALPMPLCASPLQVLTCSPTARRSARLWATPTAVGCRRLCRRTGARGRTTAATCTSPAWTPRCPTLRYPPPSTSPTSSP